MSCLWVCIQSTLLRNHNPPFVLIVIVIVVSPSITPIPTAVPPQRGAHDNFGAALTAAAAALLIAVAPSPALADVRLPPLDTDPNRCDRAFVGNTIGQANAVSDKVLDLRFCNFSGKNLSGKTLSGALLAEADATNANLTEAVMSKAYAVKTNFSGANLTNSVLDRVDFNGANLKGAVLRNAVITGCTFEGANLENADFEDSLIGNEDAKRLCLNPTLTGDSRDQVGCRGK